MIRKCQMYRLILLKESISGLTTGSKANKGPHASQRAYTHALDISFQFTLVLFGTRLSFVQSFKQIHELIKATEYGHF